MAVKKSPIFVLDIGTHSLKLLCLDPSSKVPRVLSAERLVLTQESNSLEAVKAGVQRLFADQPKAARHAIHVILPSQSVFTRYVNLPDIPKSKISQIIKFEAEQQIPFILEEVSWDYSLITRSGTRDLSIMIAAIRNTEIEGLAEIFELLKITVKSYTLVQLAYINLARYVPLPVKNFLIVDIGHEMTNIVVVEGEKGWARTIPIGSSRVEESAVHSRDLQHPQVHSFLEPLLQEVKRTFSFYASFSKDTSIERIYLTGGFSTMPGLCSYVEEELRFKTELLNCRQAFALNQSLAAEEGDLRFFYPALGAAVSEVLRQPALINLMPQRDKERVALRLIKSKISAGMLGLGCLLGLLFFCLLLGTQWKQEKIQAIVKKQATYEEFATHIKQIEQERVAYEAKMRVIASRGHRRVRFYQALVKLQKLLPENIWFTAISLDKEGTLTLQGKCAGTLADIHYFKSRLEQVPLFANVSFEEANIASGEGASAEGRTFTLRMLLI